MITQSGLYSSYDMAESQSIDLDLFVRKADLHPKNAFESTRTENQEDVKPLAKTLLVYLNCAFYTLQCPFQICYDQKRNQIICTSNKCFRRVYLVITLVAQCILGFEQCILCTPFFQWMADGSEADAMKRFMDWLINFAWFVFNAVTKWDLWSAPGEIERILVLLTKLEGKLKRTRWESFGIFQYPVALGIFYYIQMTAFSLWEVQTALSNGNGTYEGLDSTYRTIRHRITIAAAIYENQVMQIGTKLVPLISLMFMSLSASFERQDYDQDEVSDVLNLVNELSMRMKVCFGKTILASCFCLLPYDAQNLEHFFESTWDLQCQYGYYILLLIFQLWAGAQAHVKLSNVKHLPETVNKGYTSVSVVPKTDVTMDPKVRSLWLNACDHSGLGVRGHCMTLTYSFLSNLVLWMMTYSITITQFQSFHGSH